VFGRPETFGSLAVFEGGHVSFPRGVWPVAFEEKSGRLIGCRHATDGGTVNACWAPRDALDRERRKLEADSRGYTDAHEDTSVLGSLVGFLAGTAVHWSERPVSTADRIRASGVVRRLFADQPLRPLEAALVKLVAKEPETFFVPGERVETAQAAANSAVGTLMALVFRGADAVLPRGSWPWTLAREAVFTLDNRSLYTGLELERLYESEATGPLGHLVTAALLSRIGSPDARLFARRGLERSTAQHFRADARLFLEGDSALAQSVERTLDAVRALDPGEIDALARVLPVSAGNAVRAVARILRERAGRPANEVVMERLDELWEKNLRSRVEAALRGLVAP
jgi:hypothetical protein